MLSFSIFQNILRCYKCHKGLDNPKDLLKHVKDVHAVHKKPFPCHNCGISGYGTKRSLMKHLRAMCWGPEWAENWLNKGVQPVGSYRKYFVFIIVFIYLKPLSSNMYLFTSFWKLALINRLPLIIITRPVHVAHIIFSSN